ncbi:hypothetical protein RIF29_14887 [Crotalaria pallida]|uniref:Uncharacterized protein n=1 Tax=Crotalaria pallida TaxID=3830 RepID=A0AAN9FIZ8_CROPI
MAVVLPLVLRSVLTLQPNHRRRSCHRHPLASVLRHPLTLQFSLRFSLRFLQFSSLLRSHQIQGWVVPYGHCRYYLGYLRRSYSAKVVAVFVSIAGVVMTTLGKTWATDDSELTVVTMVNSSENPQSNNRFKVLLLESISYMIRYHMTDEYTVVRAIGATLMICVASTTVLSSTSGLFTLFIGAFLGQDSLNVAKVVAVFVSIAGVVMTTLGKTWATDDSELTAV